MAASSETANHALLDYQWQLITLEQQNKRRLMMAGLAYDSTTSDGIERPLLDSQVPPSQQSNLHHGLPTPSATPPNAIGFSHSPSPQINMSNAPFIDQTLTGTMHNDPSLYSTDPYNTLSYSSNGYQEHLQIPQTTQSRTTDPLKCTKDFSTAPILPEEYVASHLKYKKNYHSGLSSNSRASRISSDTVESMISSDTNNSVDFGVLTPRSQWDEQLIFSQFCLYETKYEAPTDLDDSFKFQLAETLAVTDLFPWGCHETLTSPPNKDLKLSTAGGSKFSINSLSSRPFADGILDRTPPKGGIRPQISSNVPQEHEQGTEQFRYITNESGTEFRAFQIPMSQNREILSEPNYDEDILITIEPPPLSCAIMSVNNTPPGDERAYYQRPTSSPSPMSVSSSEISSWSSDNDTDWVDDEPDDEHRTIDTSIINHDTNTFAKCKLPNLSTKPVLSKLKQDLVDRIMLEFWQVFNQEKEISMFEDTISRTTRLHQCQEPDTSPRNDQNETSTAKSSTKVYVQNNSCHRVGGEKGKRKRQGQDDDENDERDNRKSKRPKILLSSPRNQDDINKFACPYRKHDARKYCVRRWRSCALTPLETVARVKGHLYRHHRIFQCQRCKKLFNDQNEVNGHLKELKGCELLEVEQEDGITNEIVEKLRSKKKTHRDQSEGDRWKGIYQILFPGEMVPSPFFEEIQEETIQSPDSQELADYEEYCRRELPRVFRTSLEEIVNNNTQPLEEQLRSQLMDLIRDAQDRVFSSYRSSSSTTVGTSARGAPNSSPPTVTSSSSLQGLSTSPLKNHAVIGNSGDRNQAQLLAFFQPPSPQNHLESSLSISDRNVTLSKSDRNDQSDSGYDSSSLALPSTLSLTLDDFAVNTSISSSQTPSLPEMSQETTTYVDSEVALTQAKLDSNARGITNSDDGHMDWGDYSLQDTSGFNVDLSDLLNFDSDGFINGDIY